MSNNTVAFPPDNYSVIKGQILILNVTLTSDTAISPGSYIYLENKTNVTLESPIPNINLSENGTTGTFIIQLRISSTVNSGDTVSFDIVPSSSSGGFPSQKIKYTARTLNNDSLRLNFDRTSLDVPTSENTPPKGISTRVSTLIKDEKNNPIPYLAVLINTNDDNLLDKINIYEYDNHTPVNVQNFFYYKGIYLASDQHGRLSFYIYPKLDEALILSLNTQVFGVGGAEPSSDTLNITHNDPAGVTHKLPSPEIEGFNGGELVNHGDTKFLVKIPHYLGARENDTIRFYVNNHDAGVDYPLVDIDKLDKFSISLPYYIFPVGVVSEFYYKIVHTDSANILISNPLELTYTGEPWPAPVYYDKCVVYSSFGASDPSNIIDDFDNMDCVDIKYNNVVTCENISNNGLNSTGLFVQITGTNDPNDMTKPPLGSKIRLHLKINARYRNVDKWFNGSIPDQPGSDGITAVGTIEIPYNYLTGCSEYENCHTGMIQFTYFIDNDDKSSHTKVWKGRISTALPGTPPDCTP
ncbi:conserved protein of unknown function [Xenorhabdus poinarii G6]|uniref:Uncharacterized protein n=1 Tax=Xenorhabdus poinarii G6 TaxID=1354304 RepID=A0A068QYG7_9GAMM|nr:hypothetical protein [Xenorhabdus poinarii]CDG19819.1 conserved protein of unknown function [Xenorhabdus poinarii G6]